VLDYVFLDEAEKTYWIVDYKTSLPGDGQSLDDFLAAESERYALQLSLYGTALAAIKAAPVRCALYFVALGRHHEVRWCDQPG
jgi:ATP-dependent exoDNAse (exonuclease V) beta subunit